MKTSLIARRKASLYSTEGSTYVLAFYMYMATFWQQFVSLGAAISVVTFALSMVIIIPYGYYALKRWVGL